MKARLILFVAMLSAGFSPAWGLYTGNDHYDRGDLNSEKRLDREYFSNLVAYRAIWELPPGVQDPAAYFRTTEGSITNKLLYIRREAGLHVAVSSASWMGYALRQREDLEERFFYQKVEMELRAKWPVALRFFGQPTHRKEESDIGAGLAWRGQNLSMQVDATAVDFSHNTRSLEGEHDKRAPWNVQTQVAWQAGTWAIEARWDLDSPLERDFPSEDNRFNHRAVIADIRWVAGPWMAKAFSENHRRSVDGLSTGMRLQDFHKEAVGGTLERSFKWREHALRPGLQVQWRDAVFASSTTANDFKRERVEWNPYLEFDAKISDRLSMPLGIYFAAGNDRESLGVAPEVRDFSFQAKMRTPLRIDFNPHVKLVLSPTWDLDELGSHKSFDGGNVMFEARF